MRAMMKGHSTRRSVRRSIVSAVTTKADVRDYDEIHDHILDDGRQPQQGIIKQFPRKFR